MRDRYRVLYRGGEGETVEKKSRFIATIRPVESEEEAAAFIAMMKKQYWDASHNCSAFTVGENNEVTRCSDDGEPAQTAGRPMLDVLLGEEIHNVCAVVTRYFGGTLLGTGVNVVAPDNRAENGTSIEAAHVAGAAANLLSWALRNETVLTLNTSSAKSILIRGARRNSNITYPNREWGYGMLDLYNSFLRIRQ